MRNPLLISTTFTGYQFPALGTCNFHKTGQHFGTLREVGGALKGKGFRIPKKIGVACFRGHFEMLPNFLDILT